MRSSTGMQYGAGVLVTLVLTLACCVQPAPVRAAESGDLLLHPGSAVEDALKLLGPPDERLAGLPGVRGDAQRQLREMGIETLVYRARGIEISAREGKLFSVAVSEPFRGTYHGFKLGVSFTDIQSVRGNPDQSYFGPGAKRNSYLAGEVWRPRITDSQAGYYVGGVSEHVIVYAIDPETGRVLRISESDDRIRGKFFIVPSVK